MNRLEALYDEQYQLVKNQSKKIGVKYEEIAKKLQFIDGKKN